MHICTLAARSVATHRRTCAERSKSVSESRRGHSGCTVILANNRGDVRRLGCLGRKEKTNKDNAREKEGGETGKSSLWPSASVSLAHPGPVL